MTKTGFDSVSLRAVLIFMVVVLTGAFAGGFYYSQNWLNTFASKVNKTSAELASQDSIQIQSALKTELFNLKPYVAKASAITASNKTYLSVATRDLNRYASATGVVITNISPAQLTTSPSTTTVAGLQTKYIKVTLSSPITFNNLIKFIKAIETNIPKMQLTGISLDHDAGIGNKISVDPIIIEVYTK